MVREIRSRFEIVSNGWLVLLDEEMVQKDKKYRNPRDVWSKESRGAVLLQPCNMTNMFYFIFILRLFYAVAQDFCQTLTRVCGPVGTNIARPKDLTLPGFCRSSKNRIVSS